MNARTRKLLYFIALKATGSGRGIVPSSTLFDFGDIELQEVVDPLQKLLSVHYIGRLLCLLRTILSEHGWNTLIHPLWTICQAIMRCRIRLEGCDQWPEESQEVFCADRALVLLQLSC